MTTTGMAPVATSTQSGGVDPALLEVLGKKAAGLHLRGGMDPGDAVVKVASDEASAGQAFTTEHLRRITEHANMDIHQQLFAKEADKNTVFPLADPDKVIQHLGTQSVNKIPVPSAQDAVSAAMPKTSGYFPGKDTADLAEGFRTDSKVEEYPEHNPMGRLQKLSYTVHGAEDEILSKKAGVEILLEETQGTLFHHIKQASLYGQTLADISAALSAAGSEKLAQAVCTAAHEKLQSELQYQQTDQTVKTASGVLNMEHPMVQSFLMLGTLTTKLAALKRSAQIVAEQRADVDKKLHDKIRAA